LEPVLLRIIQEALNNVGKHAHARMAFVQLNLEANDWMILTIQDDGVGFDPAILDQAVQRGQIGLARIRERVEDLGGTFLLQSHRGRGTKVQVTLPVRCNELNAEPQEVSSKVKTSNGLLPICSSCKKIRDGQGYWHQVDAYLGKHFHLQFSHGICPDCAKELYPDLWQDDEPLEQLEQPE